MRSRFPVIPSLIPFNFAIIGREFLAWSLMQSYSFIVISLLLLTLRFAVLYCSKLRFSGGNAQLVALLRKIVIPICFTTAGCFVMLKNCTAWRYRSAFVVMPYSKLYNYQDASYHPKDHLVMSPHPVSMHPQRLCQCPVYHVAVWSSAVMSFVGD